MGEAKKLSKYNAIQTKNVSNTVRNVQNTQIQKQSKLGAGEGEDVALLLMGFVLRMMRYSGMQC